MHPVFSVVVSGMSISGNYDDAAEVENCIQLILDAGVVKANHSIGSTYILDSDGKYVSKFILAVSTVVWNLLATCRL